MKEGQLSNVRSEGGNDARVSLNRVVYLDLLTREKMGLKQEENNVC